MNLKKLEYLNEFLTEQMNHWLFFSLVLAVSVNMLILRFRMAPFFLLWALCSLFPTAFFWVRKKGDDAEIPFYKQILLHLLLVLPAFLIPVQGRKIDRSICVGCALLYMLISLHRCLKKNTMFSSPVQLPLAILIVCFSCFFHYTIQKDVLLKNAYWEESCLFSLIFSLALFFVIMYIQQYMSFLKVNSSSTGYLPAGEIFHSGLRLVLGYTVIGILLMVFVSHTSWFQGIGEMLRNVFFRFLRWVLAFLPKASEGDEFITQQESTAPVGELPVLERQEPFWLWEILQYVFVLLVVVLVVYLLFKGLSKLISLLQMRFAFRRKANQMPETEVSDVREFCDDTEKRTKRRRRHFGILSNEEKIRRLYRKKLLSSEDRMTTQDRKRLALYTAREWEKKLAVKGMAKIYETARYSEQKISDEDVRSMKAACKKGSKSDIEI